MAPREREQMTSREKPLVEKAKTLASDAHYIPPEDMKELLTAGPSMGFLYDGSVLGDHYKALPLMSRLNWLHVPLLTLTPAMALYGIFTWNFNMKTLIWAVAYYFYSGLGITAGYHRLYAHRAYKATPFMRMMLILMGTGAVEGSARWWSRDHRAHHRYVDTAKDPYSAAKGFWHAHIGWMLSKQDKAKIGYADITDLNEDPLCRWQHKYYLPLALIMGFFIPTAVAGLGWNDWYGGFYIAAVARLVFVHHSTFFVNSLAHYAGAATFSDAHTARNSVITALLTVGEGYHNFHHEFPQDYRNGVEYWQYDPTKWFIAVLAFFGLAYDLKLFPANEINKGKLQMQAKALARAKAEIYWGPDPASLRVYTADEIAKKVAGGAKWVIVDGFVLDVAKFIDDHPGGAALIRAELGNDITAKFKGESYRHSNAARNLAATMRVGRVSGYW